MRTLTKRLHSSLAIVFFLFFSPYAKAQLVWVGGSNLTNQLGVYGILGQASSNNIPGARSSGCHWQTSDGKVYLFGGYGYDENGNHGDLNDLWMYDPVIKQWTWVGGTKIINHNGVYGTKGVPSTNNVPCARSAATTWVDAQNNLWLFGGAPLSSGSLLNDLWRYNITTGEWTWVSGSHDLEAHISGVYGTKGVAHPNNVPGEREGATGWMDATSNILWLFGGYGVNAAGTNGIFNDLWRFDIATGLWTWVKGESLGSMPKGVYGTKGIGHPDNTPGSRDFTNSWTDAEGNLWLFGGAGSAKDEGFLGPLNDLWKFDPISNTWTWISGSDELNATGFYGQKGIPANNNVPGGRQFATHWADEAGNFFLFGGYGYGESEGNIGNLNDLWRFDIATQTWTWIHGNSSIDLPNNYGVKNVPAPTNMIGGRGLTMSWFHDRKLYLFGGGIVAATQTSLFSDLWTFHLDVILPVRFADFAGTRKNSEIWLHWSTSEESNNKSFIIERASDQGKFIAIGAKEPSNHPGVKKYQFIDPSPKRGVNLYRIRQVDIDGTSSFSKTIAIALPETAAWFFYPNPATNLLHLQLPNPKERATVYLYNQAGQLILAKNIPDHASVDITFLSKGTYYIHLVQGEKRIVDKLKVTLKKMSEVLLCR